MFEIYYFNIYIPTHAAELYQRHFAVYGIEYYRDLQWEGEMEEKGKRLPCQHWRFLLSQLCTTDFDIGLLTDGCEGGCNVDLKCVWG